MVINLPIDINKVKGFMDPSEGNALYSYAKEFTSKGDALEIGSYCGKSAVYIGSAVKENKQKLYSIDHHKGSEEQQLGEEYFDPDLINKEGDGIDTLPFFLETIRDSSLEGFVIPIVSSSEEAHEDLKINFNMVFIDGGHSFESANNDFLNWESKILTGGSLVIHDIYENPAEGGQAPFEIYKKALQKNFKEYERIDTIVCLIKG